MSGYDPQDLPETNAIKIKCYRYQLSKCHFNELSEGLEIVLE